MWIKNGINKREIANAACKEEDRRSDTEQKDAVSRNHIKYLQIEEERSLLKRSIVSLGVVNSICFRIRIHEKIFAFYK